LLINAKIAYGCQRINAAATEKDTFPRYTAFHLPGHNVQTRRRCRHGNQSQVNRRYALTWEIQSLCSGGLGRGVKREGYVVVVLLKSRGVIISLRKAFEP